MIEAIGYARIVETDGVYTVPEETLPVECIAQHKVAEHREMGLMRKALRQAQKDGQLKGRIEGAVITALVLLAAWAVTL